MLPNSIPRAPGWALFTGELGHALILAALLAFLVGAVNAALPKPPLGPKAGFWLNLAGALGLFGALVCLGTLLANDQFEFNYVFGHSDAAAELKYKIAGIWAGQQGSFLLWACTSALFGLLAAPKDPAYRRWYQLFFAVFLAALCGILTYETPFAVTRIDGVALLPPTGAGLNASLQNYWVVIHPPTIFMGFGSLTVAAAYGLAAMVTGNLTGWVAPLRPWAILSASILGIGLCMGGFWAYETLGWGGFWAWDPVENVSFVPWIFSIALLHGLLVQSARKTWFGANLVLAGLPFFVFCYGTFLTRSGFLSEASVHSFAEMNRVALWILGAVVVLGTAAYYTLYGLRGRLLAKAIQPPDDAPGLTRERAYGSGVLLLSGLATSTAVGMSVPFFLALAHRNSKVVEEGLYHKVVVWFFVPIMLFMAVAPFISWRAMTSRELWRRLTVVSAITVFLLGCIVLVFKYDPNWGDAVQETHTIAFPFNIQFPLWPWIAFLTGLCLFVIVANVWRIVEVWKGSKWSLGGFIAHIGLAILMAGLVISRGFERKVQVLVQQTKPPVEALGYTIGYQDMTGADLFQRDNKAKFDVISKDGSDHFVATPSLYFTIDPQDQKPQPVVWPYLRHTPTYDIYFALHGPVFNVWDAPINFQKGETKDPDSKGIEITYLGYHAEGAGGIGAKFTADLKVRVEDTNQQWREYEAHPTLQITQDGPNPTFAEVGDEFVVSLDRIDANDKSADLQVEFKHPFFPVDLFFKPMVILVWLGAGIMTLGGLIAAFYRRPPKPQKPKPSMPPKREEELVADPRVETPEGEREPVAS